MSARTPECVAEARRLRAEGRSYYEIGAALGIAYTTARRWCDEQAAERDRADARAYKAAHRAEMAAYDRAYAEAHKVECGECGHQYHHGSARRENSGKCCPGCVRKRRERIVAWWDEGLTLREIGERLGWTKNHVGEEINRMRAAGYDLPYRLDPAWLENVRDGIKRARERVAA